MRQEFTIPGRLAGLNEYVDASREHHWQRTRLKQEQEAIVREAAEAAGIVPAKCPVEVRVTYYEGKARPRQRVRDLDNVAGGGNKFIMDALVSMGVLGGDDAASIPRLYVKGFKATGEPRIVVEIIEIEGV